MLLTYCYNYNFALYYVLSIGRWFKSVWKDKCLAHNPDPSLISENVRPLYYLFIIKMLDNWYSSTHCPKKLNFIVRCRWKSRLKQSKMAYPPFPYGGHPLNAIVTGTKFIVFHLWNLSGVKLYKSCVNAGALYKFKFITR